MFTTLFYTRYDSPVGKLIICGSPDALHFLLFENGKHPYAVQQNWTYDSRPLESVIVQLDRYFAGQLQQFDIRLSLAGTSFQQQVWQALHHIPFGSTLTYSELAARAARPAAIRAAGAANGANPVSIVLPCHRVLGANGSLTGYAGGLDAKRWLLRHEGVI